MKHNYLIFVDGEIITVALSDMSWYIFGIYVVRRFKIKFLQTLKYAIQYY